MESSVVHPALSPVQLELILFLLNTLLLKCDFPGSAKCKPADSAWHLERWRGKQTAVVSLVPPRNGPKILVFPSLLLGHLLSLLQHNCSCSLVVILSTLPFGTKDWEKVVVFCVRGHPQAVSPDLCYLEKNGHMGT